MQLGSLHKLNHLYFIPLNFLLPAANDIAHYALAQTFVKKTRLVWDVKVALACQRSSSFNDFITPVVAIFRDLDVTTQTSKTSRQNKLKLLSLSNL